MIVFRSGVHVPKSAEPGEYTTEHADVTTATAADVPANVAAGCQSARPGLYAFQPCYQLTAQSKRQCAR